MLKINFLKMPKPRQFTYIPRYYDPELEKFDSVRKRTLNNDNASTRKTTLSFSKQMTDRRKAHKSSIIRLALIITLLAFITWRLLQ